MIVTSTGLCSHIIYIAANLINGSFSLTFMRQSLVHEGNVVPKSLYKSLSDEDGTRSPMHDRDGNHIYQSVDMQTAEVHEVLIRNNDPHSILTWDFDVLRSKLKFNVYRTTSKITATGRFTLDSNEVLR